jgi:hypothetical protein
METRQPKAVLSGLHKMYCLSWKTKNARLQSGAFQGNRIFRSFGRMRWLSGSAHCLLAQKHEKEFIADILPQGSDAALD